MTEAERDLLLACATFCRSAIASSTHKMSARDDMLVRMMRGGPELEAALEEHDARMARAEQALAEIDAAIEAVFPGQAAAMDAALKSAP